jgi:hypothetical protein
MKTVSLVMLIVLFSTTIQSQNFYIRGGGGAAISISPQYSVQQSQTTGSNYYTEDAKKTGMGDGFPITLACGYNLSGHFAFELGVNYFRSITYSVETYSYFSNPIYYLPEYINKKSHAGILSLVPAFVLKFGAGRFTPYGRIGMKIGILNSIMTKEVENAENTDGSYTKLETTSVDQGGLSVGAQVAVGTEYAFSKVFSLFGEINIDALSWSPDKGRYTVYKVDGVDKLGDLHENEKSWVYETNVSSSDQYTLDNPAGSQESAVGSRQSLFIFHFSLFNIPSTVTGKMIIL